MKIDNSVILTIVNRGYADSVMQSAIEAGATGGTVINARGTGGIEIAKFVGITIQPEKEVVLILATEEKRHDIMMSIYKDNGLTSEAKGFSISLPVSQVLGGVGFKCDEEKESKDEEK